MTEACRDLVAYLRAAYDIPTRCLVVGRCIASNVMSVLTNPVIETYDISARIALHRMVLLHVRESIELWRGAAHSDPDGSKLCEQLLMMNRVAAQHAERAREHGVDALTIQGMFIEEKYGHA